MSETLTISQLYDVLECLIDDGHGDKEFQIYYDGETVYTTIEDGSLIRVFDDCVRFTDYKGDYND